MSEQLRNEKIPSGLYTLIDVDGSNLGVKPIAKIREMGEESDYDCVLVNNSVRPGIVRLQEKMDEGKRKYQESKAARKNKQKAIKTKEFRVDRPLTIQQHDLDRKMNQVINAVKKNYSVTFTFRAMGRYADENHWGDVVAKFEECFEYISSDENVQVVSKKEAENRIHAIFRYTNKK